jgi:hypothetical protein
MKRLGALPQNRSRGSFPRSLLLMEGDRASVANRLTKLVGLPDVRIEETDYWMPSPVRNAFGEWDLNSIEETKLGESKGFLSNEQRKRVTDWWLALPKGANTPNWDIASTCTIGEKHGLLLVEAKAHNTELKKEGKLRDENASAGSIANHEQIGRAIADASAGLKEAMQDWDLSRDSHYQLSNRFAWAWKLASMDVPVVLVYLGFLCATEVIDLGEPFVDCADWSRVVLKHSRNIVPERAWGRDIRVGSVTIKPLIRVWEQKFPA